MRRMVLAIALATMVVSTALTGAETPGSVVARFSETLAGVMRQAGTLGYPARMARLEAAIARDFDLDHMTQDAVGPAWDGLAPAARARLVHAVGRAIAADYANRYDRNGAPLLVLMPDPVQGRGGVVVETRLMPSPDEDPIISSYVVRHGPDGWRIVDVLLMGAASEQSTRRAEFRTVIDRRGVEGLIATLEELARPPPGTR